MQTEMLLKIIDDYQNQKNEQKDERYYVAKRALILLKILSTSYSNFRSRNTIERVLEKSNLINNVHKIIYENCDNFSIEDMINKMLKDRNIQLTDL